MTAGFLGKRTRRGRRFFGYRGAGSGLLGKPALRGQRSPALNRRTYTPPCPDGTYWRAAGCYPPCDTMDAHTIPSGGSHCDSMYIREDGTVCHKDDSSTDKICIYECTDGTIESEPPHA